MTLITRLMIGRKNTVVNYNNLLWDTGSSTIPIGAVRLMYLGMCLGKEYGNGFQSFNMFKMWTEE